MVQHLLDNFLVAIRRYIVRWVLLHRCQSMLASTQHMLAQVLVAKNTMILHERYFLIVYSASFFNINLVVDM